MKTWASEQRVASSFEELQSSYNRLYGEGGWLGEHRNLGQAQELLNLLEIHQGRLLDVACGLGYLVDMAEKRGVGAYGIDISIEALKKAKSESTEHKVVLGVGESLPWPSNTFDYVTCLGSLEHFIDHEEGAREIARTLKPTGKAAIMLPNSHHLLSIYNVYRTGGILPEIQDFERFGTRVEWQALLESNGLQVVSVHKYNVGFSRMYKKGREGFWYFYNILYRLFGDFWIPTNLSFSLTFICTKAKTFS